MSIYTVAKALFFEFANFFVPFGKIAATVFYPEEQTEAAGSTTENSKANQQKDRILSGLDSAIFFTGVAYCAVKNFELKALREAAERNNTRLRKELQDAGEAVSLLPRGFINLTKGINDFKLEYLDLIIKGISVGFMTWGLFDATEAEDEQQFEGAKKFLNGLFMLVFVVSHVITGALSRRVTSGLETNNAELNLIYNPSGVLILLWHHPN